MPTVSYEFIDQHDEMTDQLRELRASVRVATDDLRQLAATLHTEDHESIYDALVDIAKSLERDAGIYRADAKRKEAE
ncbi:hypothetical protein I532_04075 [Brevibacillus borstelensis AK1]|uniref:Uncharacterized protein n=1 Tax=Brevibacillus borstelensis AK1 TaxID=1300222 RepID=M8DM93_9BACL|nr:hypothetical protein [Brevibacillus borstelensis]EMT54753.1 hypothetical protein I532_04075 [Brevibacillus borstelensis AK1]